MILGFVVLLVILVLFAEQWSIENGLEGLEGDFSPDENIVDPEEVFDVTVSIENKRRLPLFYVKIATEFAGERKHSSTWLKGMQKVKVKIPVSIEKRGRHVLEYPNLCCGDFLGIKEKRKALERFREVVVAPKMYGGQEVKQVLGKFLGDFSVRRFLHEDPILTIGFREYTGREPMKMISWKQSAQRQQLMVKEFDHTVEPILSVIVNVETSAEDKKELLEKCFSIARSVCSNLESKGISYDFHTNALMAGGTGEDYAVSEGLGDRHFTRVLELLGRSTYVSAFSIAKLIERAECSGGKDRGKIVITPSEECMITGNQQGQVLILKATEL